MEMLLQRHLFTAAVLWGKPAAAAAAERLLLLLAKRWLLALFPAALCEASPFPGAVPDAASSNKTSVEVSRAEMPARSWP